MSPNNILILIMTSYYFYIIFIAFYMFAVRKKAIKSRAVSIKHFKSYDSESTEEMKVTHNHFMNQFQIPMIFFIVCVLSLQQGKANNISIGLAIAFVVSRLVHSKIHLGTNDVPKRALSYLMGMILVGLMFINNLI